MQCDNLGPQKITQATKINSPIRYALKTLIITLQTTLLIPVKLIRVSKATKPIRNKVHECLIKQSNLQIRMFNKVLYKPIYVGPVILAWDLGVCSSSKSQVRFSLESI